MFQTYFRTIFKIDKKSTFICIIYNLLKQLLNVFYGVYFLRLILVHVETDRDLTAVLWVLLGMLAINVGFHFGDQYFKNVYTPVFQTKLEQHLYETISDRAADVPYDQYCQPDFLNSLGGMKSYMDLLEKYDRFQGGFIWDFIDQALWVEDEVTGRRVLRYGGDFDDRPSDYAFSGDGIVFADRTVKPAIQEVKYDYGTYK